MKKGLTLKQLYGYSIMKWDATLKNLETLGIARRCAFCLDLGWGRNCDFCKINKAICDDHGDDGFFNRVATAREILANLTYEIRYQLKKEYEKFDKVKK